jgi:hypothetical protein
LLPGGRPGRRFAGADDDDPIAAGTVLFLLPWGRPRPPGTDGGPRSRRDPSAPAIWKSGKINPRWKRRRCGGGRIRFRVFTLTKGALFISTY